MVFQELKLPVIKCKSCGDIKPHKAKGFCVKCYSRIKKTCPNCGNYSKMITKTKCNKCYKSPKQICCICKKNKEIAVKEGPICRSCYKGKIIECSKCFKHMPIYSYIDGFPICVKCYEAPKYKCKCGEIKPIEANKLCSKCYGKQYKRKTILCKCGNIGIKKNNLCEKCYEAPKHKCKCGEIKEGYKKTENGTICRNCYRKERYKNDNNYRIKTKLRARFGNIKNKSIKYNDIIDHLKPFPENIDEYHIDHIFPLSAFDFNDPIHIKAAFAPENHQWLKAKDNMSKSDKFDRKEFLLYIEHFRRNNGYNL